MSMASDYIFEAVDIWNEFENKLIYENRFFPNCRLIELLNEIIENNQKVIKQDIILYRARIFRKDNAFMYSNSVIEQLQAISNSKKGFYGFGENECGAPTCDKATAGRSNPENIAYLYLADNKYTAMCEIRPFLNSKVNIAEFKVKSDLNIIDLSSISTPRPTSLLEAVNIYILYNFSIPVNNDEKKKYLPTQYIAEYIKNKGYDGIKYGSSLSNIGNNITVFDKNKAEAIGSKVYEIEQISYIGKCIMPNSGEKIQPLNIKKLPPI